MKRFNYILAGNYKALEALYAEKAALETKLAKCFDFGVRVKVSYPTDSENGTILWRIFGTTESGIRKVTPYWKLQDGREVHQDFLTRIET